MTKLLNLVNENDEIIGQATREAIHRDGLLHREIHVIFVTPQKEIIFQHRAPNKETSPDLLDATVGGHVEIGDSYEATAIKESEEETGVKLNPDELILINKVKKRFEDVVTGKINYAFRTRYAYIYKGDPKDLVAEPEESLGFEVWPLNRILGLGEGDRSKFTRSIIDFVASELVKFI